VPAFTTNRYQSLLSELRRNIDGLSAAAAIVIERALLISKGGLLYAGAGEMAGWLGDDDRRTAQRIRRWAINRGLLVVVEQRHRENGADSVLVCRFAETVLAIYRRWQKAREAASTTECHRADDRMSPALESEAKREDSDSKIKREDPVRRAAPPAEPRANLPGVGPRPRAAAEPAGGSNPHARRHWLRRLNAFVSERLSGPQQWLGWELIAKAEQGALIDRAERRQLDDIDRAMRACGYRA
jgi:hypothetical protein